MITFPKDQFPPIFGGRLEFLRKMQKRIFLGNGARYKDYVKFSCCVHVVDPSSASDHNSDYSVDPQPAPSRPKKHSEKSEHKSRARFLPSSSEENQFPEHRHRSPKPSGKSYSDQDHPQHDPDPPYYREVALSDIPICRGGGYVPTHPKTSRFYGIPFWIFNSGHGP